MGARAIVCCALTCTVGAACSRSGSDTVYTTYSPFRQSFFPIQLEAPTSSGDVAFRFDGDLYVVAGTAEVAAVSRDDGSVSILASGVGGAGTSLISVVVGADGRLFAGDDAGNIYAIDSEGQSSLLVDSSTTGTTERISGLQVAPAGFGDLEGALVAAAGDAGILVIRPTAATVTVLASPGQRYVDVAFSGTTLFALDASDDEIDTVDSEGTVESFQTGLTDPVGMAVDGASAEIVVADAGEDALYTVPVAGGELIARAPCDFDSEAPSGISYDGIGTLAWITSGPVVRGARVPRIDTNNTSFGASFGAPNVGYGDLEFGHNGDFLLVANHEDDPSVEDDDVTNFLFEAPRDLSSLTTLASEVGAEGERLLSLAVDPVDDPIYFGSDAGNVYQYLEETVSFLVTASGGAILGLEIAPVGFGGFAGHLVATTASGEVLAFDPLSPAIVTQLALIQGTTGERARLSDLVFASDGTLYVLDNGEPGDARVLIVEPDGRVSDLGANPNLLGRPDGIEIDEGGKRLLIASSGASGDTVIAVSLDDASVLPIANVSIDDGFFPTGVIYDRLGIVVLRSGDAFTALDAAVTFP